MHPASAAVGSPARHSTPLQIGGAHALIPSTILGFDIEGLNDYCAGGGYSCVAATNPNGVAENCGQENNSLNPVSCPGLNRALAKSFGPYNGTTYGTPKEVEVGCATYTAGGWRTIGFKYVTSDSKYDPYAEVGTITGKSTLFGSPSSPMTGSENNPAQVSSQNFSVYDPNYAPDAGDVPSNAYFRASVSGTQNTNNIPSPDTLNSGSFTITITGWISTFDNYGNPISPNGSGYDGYFGTLSCEAGGPHAYDLLNAGYQYDYDTYFEGEMEFRLI